jgi:integrase
MPRKPLIPSYRLHKPSGLARAIVDGKHIYLGPYGSEESHAAYAKLIADQFGNPIAQLPPSTHGDRYPDISVNELLVRYFDFAETYYALDGKPTKEYRAMKDAAVPLRTLFSHLPAREFGPLRLKAVQKYLEDQGRRCRTEINRLVKRLCRIYSWAASEELVPPDVHAALRQVNCLRRGKTKAHEAKKVKPVADWIVNATIPFLSPQVAAMVMLQRWAATRPGEIVIMRPVDIDQSDDVWLYRPSTHKNDWRDQTRVIALGPQAQAVIRPFLDRPADSYLFSPTEAEAWRNEQRGINRNPDRKTPIYPCELRARQCRQQKAKRRVSKRPKRARYDVDSYRRAIHYGTVRANRELAKSDPEFKPLPFWFPYQLRHTAGDELKKKFGAEAVPLGLGNSPDLVAIYTERDIQQLKEIARALR